ncbi:hypothetical protein E4U33_003002 [Claviceps sp. LM78 group G4]|nr:hypothetical protein E4U33_003002 [Claviceps sp. LM78 group G4]
MTEAEWVEKVVIPNCFDPDDPTNPLSHARDVRDARVSIAGSSSIATWSPL